MENIEILKKYNVDVDAALELWGDIPSLNDALKEYLESMPKKCKDLENFLAAKDCANYAILAHSLKSEAKYLGFMKEAETFLDHELKGKEENISYLEENFKYLRETTKKITNIIREYFGEKKKLLIADDSNIILNFLEKNVSDNYDVVKAQDGVSAIRFMEECNPYAILLDLNMPNLNGFEVLEYLKSHELLNDIPVIVITGDDTSENIEKAFSYPILNVLKKPFNDLNIKNTLDKIENFYQDKNQ